MDGEDFEQDQICYCDECWVEGDETAFLKVESMKIPKQIDISLKNFSGLGTRLTEQAEGMLDFLKNQLGVNLPFVMSLALRRSYYAEYRITGQILVSRISDRYTPHIEDRVSKQFRTDTPLAEPIEEQILLNALGVLTSSWAAEYQSESDTQSAFDVIAQSQFLFSYSTRLSAIEAQVESMEDQKKGTYSAAGALGAMARHRKYEPLKQWALKEAGNMQGAHKQIARALRRTLPAHLKDVSDDPERLIYDTLRANKKP